MFIFGIAALSLVCCGKVAMPALRGVKIGWRACSKSDL
jgi:hypothetical protein